MTTLRTANLLGALALMIVDRIKAEVEGGLGHGGEAPGALITIGHEPGLSNDLLRQALGLTHSGTVRLVDRLQREGLVTRRPGTDGRTVALYLTASGETVRHQLLRKRAATLDPLVSTLSAQQVEVLDGILEQMLQQAFNTPSDAYHICRWCDEQACHICPMER